MPRFRNAKLVPQFKPGQARWKDLLMRLECSPLITREEQEFLEACFDLHYFIGCAPKLQDIIRQVPLCKEPLDRSFELTRKVIFKEGS